MATAEEVYAELHPGERDDYKGTPAVYYILRGEQVVGHVFWNPDAERWCAAASRDHEAHELAVTNPEEAVEAGLRWYAAELADAES